MKKTIAYTLFASSLTSGLVEGQEQRTYEQRGTTWVRIESGVEYQVDAEVISLRFKDHRALPAVSLDGPLENFQLVRSNRLNIHDLKIPIGADPLATVLELEATGLFEFVEENTIGHYIGTPNDTRFDEQWNLENTGQTGGTPGADVHALEAWDIEDGDPSIIVAVIDSGTDWNHPDLVDAMWDNTDESLNGLDDDGNGFVDDIRGWDFDDGDNDPTGAIFHGTGVASCVGASSNNVEGVAALAGGACDGTGVSLMNLNVGDFAPNSAVLDDAILYAADNGAHILTMSLTVGDSAAITSAIEFAYDTTGSFIDCAAGNNGFSVTYPANLGDVMAIASNDHNDNQSSFSNPGPEIEVAAPGDNVLMADLGGGYLLSSGTSFSAPHVAALAGLILSLNPALANEDVRQILKDSADDIDAVGFDNQTGWGRINALNALLLADGNFVPASISEYGVGLAGTGGLVPDILVLGNAEPILGTTGYSIRLRDALANTSALLVFGFGQDAIPFKGGEILVDLTNPFLLIPSAVNGGGGTQFSFDIPDDDSILGVQFNCQWVVTDAGAAKGTALSEGLEGVIGNG